MMKGTFQTPLKRKTKLFSEKPITSNSFLGPVTMVFQDFFKQIQGPFIPKSFVIQYINSAISFTDQTCFWGKIEPPMLFSYIVTSKVLCPFVTNRRVMEHRESANTSLLPAKTVKVI